MDRSLRAGRCRSLTALLCALVLPGLVAPAVAGADPAPVAGCPSQQQALEAANADIGRHNAQPHVFKVPQEQAAFDAYNVEAAQLTQRAQQAEVNLKGCATVIRALAAGEPLPQATKPQADAIATAKNRLPAGYVAPPPPNGPALVAPELRPLFEQLREGKPWPDDAFLQSQSKPRVGDPDPARLGVSIPALVNDPAQPDVVVERIVPLTRLLTVPGFVKLPPEYMYMFANTPLNLQWMASSADGARNSASVAAVSGADPKWGDAQEKLRQDTEKKLADLIGQVLTTIPPSS